jgi:predicted lipoprotein with Yx(FWY)xxD motif
MKHPRALIAIVGLSAAAVAGGVAVAAAAGGSTTAALPAAPSSVVQTVSPTPSPPNSRASVASTTIHTAKATVGGSTETVLVNGKGLPLYFYKPDTSTRSMVSGALAALWPPLDATSPTESGATGTLKVVHTSNGSQVTYNGHFLYTFAEDSSGQATGQGVQDFYVATPGISATHGGSTSAAASTTTARASAGNGYGY